MDEGIINTSKCRQKTKKSNQELKEKPKAMHVYKEREKRRGCTI
jgi:hypothetical protein